MFPRNFAAQLICLLAAILAGCSGSGAQLISTAIPKATASPGAALPNFTPTPTVPTLTPSLTASPTFVPTATQTPLPVYRVCTPLQDHTLQDLKEIVTNPFDPPPAGKDTGHHGIDFAYYRRGERASILGVPVQAALGGRVAAVIKNRVPYGNMVIIETPFDKLPAGLAGLAGAQSGQSIYLLYAHMKETPLVSQGQQVACGQQLGIVGSTPAGWSSDPHLHFEARVGPQGVSFNSMSDYDNSATLEEVANYTRWRMSGDFRMFDPMVVLNLLDNSSK